MKILVIDNYDSFVYNIAQILGELGAEPVVVRNDKITLEQVKEMNPDGIVISPGPGHPADRKYFGVCTDIIRELGPKTPILGVCLGHQGIVHAFGGKVINAKKVRHGKTSPIQYMQEDRIFENVANPFKATRYHSLVAEQDSIPDCLKVTAKALDDGEIMGIKHKQYPIEGVQFHPESVLTGEGRKMLQNFLSMVKR
ncbi:anthranilate synthase component II [Candidatus Nitrososphaera gargensis Ga9.2]|uniref:anthranilate synthase n=1 Tax=Nitrososphaera gargensis (strain Ga9.2) TaxID=1237085 RepID=K0IN19_NITGG|nr:aminodeoxychorismate/anthranilate synthase component II [Candidatus Nitrososphaera gargensis]AFU58604.1 anthranilate synthase component II [Candidatus Nitrososphaera gargensis Ga9.2]